MKLNKSLKKVLENILKQTKPETTIVLNTNKYYAVFEIKAVMVDFKEKK